MPQHARTFDYSIGDPVLVREVQRPGRIEIIQVDFNGTQYRVAYWDNSDRKSVWLYPDEIEPRKTPA